MKTILTTIVILLLLSCQEKKNGELLIEDSVTIYRDTFGVPHVYGKDVNSGEAAPLKEGPNSLKNLLD
ncbi:MAG: hypothetical protein IPK94_14610 [Saprospiraceae bacterium]|jgi:acyl-homoserine lactone acylase PvdQ|nr:hypothetical protein [Saprospiraceae bacterium]MBK7371238.1 hypothetical protein [Saprospiraceae bacterium]MBK7436266.1 hypothetical protein [Saprospiraceae bacterium]MBK8281304.1 hypothetical protein [Saprospiraceae bacterium]MBK8514392.1 hypothetical protein [Saprospiraceae bacterium]